MKKTLFVILSAIGCAAVAETSLLGIDSYAIGKNAGYNGSANRSVFVGPGAGAYINNADSNTVIGAAAALDASYIYSSIAFGHYAMRNADNIEGLVAIGDQAGKGASSISDSVFIGKETGSSADYLYNDIFIGNGIGKGKNSVHDSITIGNGLVPANNTVNIGGKIICDNTGLKINGVTYNSANSTAFETMPFRAVDETFTKYWGTGSESWNNDFTARITNYYYNIQGQYNAHSGGRETASIFTAKNLKITANRAGGVSQGWDNLTLSWTVGRACIAGPSSHSIQIQNSHFTSFTPNTFTGTWENSTQTSCGYAIVWKQSYTITVTSTKITAVLKQTTRVDAMAGWVYENYPEGTATITFNYSELPTAASWKEFDRTVDAIADITHDTRLITSAGVARSINNKIDGCSLKYEDGILKLYDANGTLIGTVNVIAN